MLWGLEWYGVLIVMFSIIVIVIYALATIMYKPEDLETMSTLYNKPYWRVQVAAFRFKDNAKAHKSIIMAKGFPSVKIRHEDQFYKVIVAERKSAIEAEEWKEICEDAGLDCYIYFVEEEGDEC